MVDINAIFERYKVKYISFKFDMRNFNYCKDYISHLKKLGYFEKADMAELIYKQILKTGASGITLERGNFRILYSDLNPDSIGYVDSFCYVMMPPIFNYKKFYRKKGDKND